MKVKILYYNDTKKARYLQTQNIHGENQIDSRHFTLQDSGIAIAEVEVPDDQMLYIKVWPEMEMISTIKKDLAETLYETAKK